MDEHVLRAVIGLNKSIALLGIEPLYCSASHRTFLQNKATAIQHWWRVKSLHGTESRSGALSRAGERKRTTGVDCKEISCPRYFYKLTLRRGGWPPGVRSG